VILHWLMMRAVNQIGDEGAIRVAQALEHNSTLTSFNIGGMDQLLQM